MKILKEPRKPSEGPWWAGRQFQCECGAQVEMEADDLQLRGVFLYRQTLLVMCPCCGAEKKLHCHHPMLPIVAPDRYRKAFEAAKAYIDCDVCDPDTTDQMRIAYAEYQNAVAELSLPDAEA